MRAEIENYIEECIKVKEIIKKTSIIKNGFLVMAI